jgi:hyperosmotically inducible protein
VNNIRLILTYLVFAILTFPALGHSEDTTTSPTKTYVNDSVITSKIKADLAEEKVSSLIHIKVDTDSLGAVTLSGEVESQPLSDKASAIAQAVKGVNSVENNLKIVPKK